jgi:hypothetical protein
VRYLPEIPIRFFGALISAQLDIDQERWKALRDAGKPIPEPQHISLTIDTGASSSWIRSAYLEKLGLYQPRSWFDVVTPDGVEKQPAYEVCLILGGVGTPLTKRINTLIGCKEFEGEPHDGLLGRNELRQLRFFWNGPAESVNISYD